MESETGQPAAAVSMKKKLTDLVTEKFKNNPKFEEIYKIIEQICNIAPPNFEEICKIIEQICNIAPPKFEEIYKIIEQICNSAPPKFEEICKIFVQICNIAPLNLVIAQVLYHIAKSKEAEWTLERALDEMVDHYSTGKALSLMRCGFDMLPRSEQAKISCCWHSRQFFRQNDGVHYNVLITNWILEECFGLVDRLDTAYYEAHDVLMNLIERSLLKVEKDNVVVMEESIRGIPDSRYNGVVWKPSLGLSGVFEDKKWLGIENVGPDDGRIETYEDLKKVSVLLVDGNHLGQEVIEKYFSTLRDLEVLAIFSPRIEKIPVNVTNLGNLCFLVLKDCDLLEKIDGLEYLKTLTVLEISNAKNVKKIKNDLFDSLSKLRSLNLSETGIEELPSSLSKLHELRSINLRGCFRLKSLPMLKKLEKLQILDVCGATSLEILADKSLGALKNLQLLDLSQTKVGHVPFLKDLKDLSRLSYKDCKELIRLPNFRDLSGLQVLDLSGALMLKEVQDDTFPEVNDLKILDLSKTEISCLPSSIFKLSNLELLNLSNMPNLVRLEDDTFENMAFLHRLNLEKSMVENLPSLSGLVNLRELKLQECKLRKLPSLIAVMKLEVLDLSGCDSFVEFEDESFRHMKNLRILNVSKTKIKKLPDLSGLDNISQLLLTECINLTKLPPFSSSQLKELNAYGAKDLREWEAKLLENMNRIEILNLSGTGLRSPPLNNCTNLRELSLSGCELHTPLPLDKLTKLEVLDLSRTRIDSLQTITRLCNLRKLVLTDCLNLQEIPTLEPLVKLEDLHLQGTEIRTFPCQMWKLTRLTRLDLPKPSETLKLDWTGVQSIPGTVNWDQCGIIIPSNNLQRKENKPSMIVRDMNSFRILKGLSDIWNSCFSDIFISVCPLKEGENKEDEEVRDIYFHVTSYRKKYAPFLEIRGFESFPAGLEDVITKVDYVSLVENEFIRSLSLLGNAKSLKGCWIWSCANLEHLIQDGKDKAESSENRDTDNLKLLEILWLSNLPIFKSVHSTGRPFESVGNLKELYIDCCPEIKTLFVSSQLLINLEILHVKFCDRLEHLCESKEKRSLDKLQFLNLVELPEFTGIGLKLPSLRTANIKNCPKLKVTDDFVREKPRLIRELWDGSEIKTKTNSS